MIEIQTAVDSLMKLLLTGGADAAIELSKNAVLNGVGDLSKLWRRIFSEKPESYPLADRVAKMPTDQNLQTELRAMLAETLDEQPELIQDISIESMEITIDKVEASNGGVAVGVNIGGKINK